MRARSSGESVLKRPARAIHFCLRAASMPGQSRWWLRFASVLPLVALVGGLVLIQDWQNRTQISVAAEVDEALLGDDLPINAYRDPGFSEFLKAPPSE